MQDDGSIKGHPFLGNASLIPLIPIKNKNLSPDSKNYEPATPQPVSTGVKVPVTGNPSGIAPKI